MFVQIIIGMEPVALCRTALGIPCCKGTPKITSRQKKEKNIPQNKLLPYRESIRIKCCILALICLALVLSADSTPDKRERWRFAIYPK